MNARGMHACDGEDDVLTHSDMCRVLELNLQVEASDLTAGGSMLL